MKKLAVLEELFDSRVYPLGTVPDGVLEEVIRFRTGIYVSEGYLPASEQPVAPDCYDAQSTHICIYSKKTEKLTGYCRMVYDKPLPLPIAELCPDLKNHIDTPVEISRFSVKNHWRGKLRAAGMAPLFCLARELLVLSHQQGIRQWSCLIDERFKKLCQRFFKMDFHQLEEPQFYMGSWSVPCIINLSKSIRNNLKNPNYAAFWNTKDLREWVAELEQDES